MKHRISILVLVAFSAVACQTVPIRPDYCNEKPSLIYTVADQVHIDPRVLDSLLLYANLATATAMQDPTEKHLLRRQQYFCHILCDILHHAYQRAVQIGKEAQLDTSDYTKLFTVNVPDLSKWDNESPGRAARGLARAFQSISEELPGPSTKLSRLMMKMCFRFAGMPQSDEVLDEIMAEALQNQESIWDGLRDQYRTNNWASVADPRLYPTIGIAFRYGRQPEIFSVASPTAGLMFTNDVMPVKVRFFFAVGPMDWRGLYKHNVS